jgi:hypothetical protein
VLGNKSSFRALENSIKIQNVKSVGGHTHGVHGKGKINIAYVYGKIKTIIDVLYVPSLTKNLLLVGMIVNKGIL